MYERRVSSTSLYVSDLIETVKSEPVIQTVASTDTSYIDRPINRFFIQPRMRHNNSARMATAAAAAVMVTPSLSDLATRPSTSTAVLTEELMHWLKRARDHQTNLSVIDLEHRNLPAAYLQRLLNNCAQYQPQLRKLRLHHVMQRPCCVAASLTRVLRSSSETLTALHVGRNNGMSGATVDAIIQNLPPVLETLHWEGGTSLSSDQLVALCQAVERQGRVRTMKVGKQYWDGAAVQALIRLLEADVLVKLDLRATGIRPSMPLCRALASTTRLQALGLARNDWSSPDLDFFVEHVLCQTKNAKFRLDTLDLQQHPQLSSVQCLVDCLLHRNHRLRKLKLRDSNTIPHSQKEALLQALLLNAHGPMLARKTKLALHQHNNSQPPPKDDDDDDCVICFEPIHNGVVLLPCTHHNCCSTCSARLRICHMCREVVVTIVPRKQRPEPELEISC